MATSEDLKDEKKLRILYPIVGLKLLNDPRISKTLCMYAQGFMSFCIKWLKKK
jgi:hypothetical protein